MTSPLDVHTDGPVQIWTITLPDVGNAITGKDVIAAFEDKVDAVNTDNTVGAVILTSIEEFSRILFGGSGRGTDVIIYASLIIGVAVFYPTGILGWWTARKERRAARADASRQIAEHAASAAPVSKEAT